ncbi:hypothetical protein MYX78_12820, partial [Acidobacteria bacterium AH-259-G07]|nr:hypothetical protein [Acidobacteria bacterium AH-259-G07]
MKFKTGLEKQDQAGFTVDHHGGMHYLYLMGEEIVEISEGDLVGYEKRDPHHHERHINTRLVAEYWRAVLQDVLLLAHSQKTVLLNPYEEAKALTGIYHLVKEDTAREKNLSQALSTLSPSTREPLMHLVRAIPEKFTSPSPEQVPPIRLIKSTPPPSPPPNGSNTVVFVAIMSLIAGAGYLTYRGFTTRETAPTTPEAIGNSKALTFTLKAFKGQSPGGLSDSFQLSPGTRLYFEGDRGEAVFALGNQKAFLENINGDLFLFQDSMHLKGRKITGGETFHVATESGKIEVK